MKPRLSLDSAMTQQHVSSPVFSAITTLWQHYTRIMSAGLAAYLWGMDDPTQTHLYSIASVNADTAPSVTLVARNTSTLLRAAPNRAAAGAAADACKSRYQ